MAASLTAQDLYDQISEKAKQCGLSDKIEYALSLSVGIYEYGKRTLGMEDDPLFYQTISSILARVDAQSIKSLIEIAKWGLEQGELYYMFKTFNPSQASKFIDVTRAEAENKLECWQVDSGFAADDQEKYLDIFIKTFNDFFDRSLKLRTMLGASDQVYMHSIMRFSELSDAIKQC